MQADKESGELGRSHPDPLSHAESTPVLDCDLPEFFPEHP
jgi:hypothetical protein